jgi:hypothetical protein
MHAIDDIPGDFRPFPLVGGGEGFIDQDHRVCGQGAAFATASR